MRRLASYLNMRSLVFLLGIALLWLTPGAAPLAWLDRVLFVAASGINNGGNPDATLDLVELTEEQWRTLRDEPAAADEFFKLMDRLAGSSATVGVLLPELPRRELTRAESLLAGMGRDHPLYPEWSQQQRRHTRLHAWLSSPQVVVGTSDARWLPTSHESVAAYSPIVLDRWLSRFNVAAYYQPRVLVQDAPVAALPQGIGFPAAVPAEVSLLWREGDNLYPAAGARILQRWLNAPDIVWRQKDALPLKLWSAGALHLGTRVVKLGPGASLIPGFDATTELPAWLTPFSLAEFLARDSDNSLILVAVAGDPAARHMAAALQSVTSQHYYYSPGGLLPLFWTLLVLIMIYLCLLMPRLSGGVAISLTCLGILLLVAAQWGAMLVRSYWLPLGLLVQYLFVGCVLMVLWRQQRLPVERLRRGYHSLADRLSRALLAQGQVVEAHAVLRQCQDLAPVAEAYYEVGVHYERKRRFDDALAIYRRLYRWRPGYRDLAARISHLKSARPTPGASGEHALAKTLALSAAHTRPLFGRYEVERELGRGAMGTVYLARDPRIARQVAIKTLSYDNFDPGELASVKMRFLREAEAAGRLRHPNIVTVYDVGEDQDLAFIAMDYVSGYPLSEAVTAERLLPVAQVYRIVTQVAGALAYAHAQDVVHRDIKPANILFNPKTGQAVVTDFGVARITSDARTQTGEILGSPVYMAPEQMAGKAVTAASDIFSLGVTFYQLLSGALPFKADNLAALSYKIIHGKPVPIRDLRPGLPASATRIINKALQKDPRKRYASAAEMVKALRNASAKDF